MDYFNQESKRLKFRPVRQDDSEAWQTFFVENDNLKYLGIDLTQGKEALAQTWIEKQLTRYEESGFGHLAVELKDSGKLIGMGGLLKRDDVDGREEFEVAYSLIPAFWGKGFATEMAQTMKSFGFANLDVHRLISIIHIDHKNSAHVAQKNSMEALFRTRYLEMEVQVYGIRKAQYLSSKE